jgi:hypothetical protein
MKLKKKRVLCGYRRPKNIRDHLVRAAIPYKNGDEKNDPGYIPEIPDITQGGTDRKGARQKEGGPNENTRFFPTKIGRDGSHKHNETVQKYTSSKNST